MKTLFSILTAFLLPVAAMQAADQPTSAYPLTTCVVSGEKLGGMGSPYVFAAQGQEVKLCCAGCKDAFDKNSAEYLKKIEAARKSN